MSGNFLKGIGQSLWGTVVGVGSAIAHPINTVTGIALAVAHPINTATAIGHTVAATYKSFKEGDANTKANILGHATAEIGQLFIGVGSVKGATEAVEAGEIAQEVAKISEGVEVV